MEFVARNEYTKTEEKNPINCSLYYLALRKKNILQGLWRMATWHREHAATQRLLANDFRETRWKTAALKNAYALLGRRRFGEWYWHVLATAVCVLMTEDRVRGRFLPAGGPSTGCCACLYESTRRSSTCSCNHKSLRRGRRSCSQGNSRGKSVDGSSSRRQSVVGVVGILDASTARHGGSRIDCESLRSVLRRDATCCNAATRSLTL